MPKNREKTRGWVCRTASLFELPGPSVVSLRNLRPAHPSRRLYTLRRIYSCSFCRNHNAYHDDIISKARPHDPTLISRHLLLPRLSFPLTTSPRLPASQAFQGRHGRAFLFNDVCNITLGGKEDRLLMTGLHTVRDVFCASCSSLLGWKYDFAYEQSQKYKEGKFIVEKAMVLHEGGW